MATLRDDLFMRGRRPGRRFPVSGLHCALLFVSLALLVLSRLEHPVALQMLRHANVIVSGPVASVREAIQPVSELWRRSNRMWATDDDVSLLRDELERLRSVAHRASLDRAELDELGRLARLVGDERDGKRVTVRVLAGAGGVFRRSLLVDAGSDDGIHNGFPVFQGDALIGRVIDATGDTARVLLLSDQSSRVPVYVGAKLERAIMVGAGDLPPSLIMAGKDVRIDEGADVVTSGAAGMLPAGLSIGKVMSVAGSADAQRLGVGLHVDGLSYRFVQVRKYFGPKARLTGFLAAKAFERKIDATVRPGVRGRPVTAGRSVDPFADGADKIRALVR